MASLKAYWQKVGSMKSPCIKVCQRHTSDGLDYCAGCYRTMEEIKYWSQFDEKVQQYIIDQCYVRRNKLDIHTVLRKGDGFKST